MPARLHVPAPLSAGALISLPDTAARHVQVLRLQPGAEVCLFNGQGGQWHAEITAMRRNEVQVLVQAHEAHERELPVAVTLALGMPANERMDTVIEKATELGVAALQPLVCERSVMRLAGERADRKAAHWQAVAVAACEQSGRNRVPAVAAPRPLRDWLAGLGAAEPDGARWLLSLDQAGPLAGQPLPPAQVLVLSGPEGGLTQGEEALARAQGFVPVSLGPRVLRADTAPLAVLSWLALQAAA